MRCPCGAINRSLECEHNTTETYTYTMLPDLVKTLPRVEMSDDIVNLFTDILKRPRTLYKLLLQTLKLADGQLFLTIPAAAKVSLGNLERGSGGTVSRGESLEMLGNICSQYTHVPHHTALLDDGMQRPGDPKIGRHEHQCQIVTIENEAFYCLDRVEVPDGEIEDFIWAGASGYYSIGVLANCTVRENAAKSIELESLLRAVQCAEGVIFSVIDSEAFAIWCPKA